MKTQITTFLLLTFGVVWAQESATTKAWYEQDRLLPRHADMEESGISPFLYYDGIVSASLDGGKRTSDNFTSQVYAGMNLDLEKLLGWDDTTAKISMVNRQGNGIAGDVGGIYDPMTINGGPSGQVAWLYEAWIEKTIGDHVAVKFGRTSMDEDFANDDLYRYSLSTAINGPIRSMMLENPQIFSFPLALWGSRVKYTPNDTHKLQLGAYQINDNPFGDYLKGNDWSFRSGDGVTIMGQYDYTPEILDRPSRFYVGIADSVYDYTDFDGGTTDNLLRLYGHGAVEVTQDLTLFAFGAYTSQDETASVPLQISGGANWTGLIPGREKDRTIAFVTYGELSDKWGDSQEAPLDVDSETVYELGHRIQMLPSFYIQPSVQYIQDPGGTGDIDDAVVAGAWIGASF